MMVYVAVCTKKVDDKWSDDIINDIGLQIFYSKAEAEEFKGSYEMASIMAKSGLEFEDCERKCSVQEHEVF